MLCMQGTVLGLLLAGMLFAAEPGGVVTTKNHVVQIGSSNASDDATAVATVRSSGGLILNGVPTPRGVNSVVVTRGDVVETLGAPAIATYASGQSVTLPAATSYQSLPGRMVRGITKTQPSRVDLFGLVKISVSKK